MIKLFKKNLLHIFLTAFTLCLPMFSFAQVITNPIKAQTFTGLIKTILEGVIKIGMPVIVLAIIYSGFLFVTAQGKPAEIEKARNTLLNVLIGAAILLGSWGIAQLVTETVQSL